VSAFAYQPAHLTAASGNDTLAPPSSTDDDQELPSWWPADVLPMAPAGPMALEWGPLRGWFADNAIPAYPARHLVEGILPPPASNRAERATDIAVELPTLATHHTLKEGLATASDARPAAAAAIVAVAGALSLATRREPGANTASASNRYVADRDCLPTGF
jgi:hypothetical protein